MALPASEIGTREPKRIIEGDAYAWKIAQGDWAPATWSLDYDFVSDADRVNVTTTDALDGTWLVDLDSLITTSLTGGKDYEWFAYVDDGTDKRTIRRGRVEVLVDPRLQTSGYDYRTLNRQILEAIQALISGKALKGDQLSYSIANRQLTRYSPEELIEWEKVYMHKVRAEDRAAAIARGEDPGDKVVHIRFARAA